MREEVVGYGDSGGPHDGVYQPVFTMRQRAVINPKITRPEYGNPIAVGFCSVPVMRWAWPDIGVAGLVTMVDVDVMDDDVGDVLESNAAPAGDVDVGATAVDGFEAVEDEFLWELDVHVGGEDDPEGFSLDDSPPESAWTGVDGVVVGGVGDDVVTAAFAA